MRLPILFTYATSILLGACDANPNITDLEIFINTANSNNIDYQSEETKLPQSIEPFVYSASALIDPFNQDNLHKKKDRLKNSSKKEQSSDLNNQITSLELYSVSQLKLVGIISQTGNKWAVVETPDGKVHRVNQGHAIGNNHGRVKRISHQGLKIVELMEDKKSIRKQTEVYLWLR